MLRGAGAVWAAACSVPSKRHELRGNLRKSSQRPRHARVRRLKLGDRGGGRPEHSWGSPIRAQLPNRAGSLRPDHGLYSPPPSRGACEGGWTAKNQKNGGKIADGRYWHLYKLQIRNPGRIPWGKCAVSRPRGCVPTSVQILLTLAKTVP